MPYMTDTTETIDAFLQAHGTVHALPENTTRIIRAVNDPACSNAELERVISHDAALAGRVLHLVNSSYYSLPNKITRLDRAIAMMGLRTVKEAALSVSLTSVCRSVRLGKYDVRDLWDHSVGVAITARELAGYSKAVDAEEAFLVGMLHDIALLLVAEYEPAKAAQLLELAERGDKPFCELETDILGFTHSQLGERLAQTWKFPELACVGIRWHHDPAGAPAEHIGFCTHTYIADTLCCQANIGCALTCAQQQITDEQLKIARLSREAISTVADKLPILLRLFLN